jgi:DNA-binding transcriptional regulator GbsR (MarR family)
MKLAEAKQQFINSWGAFGTQWGINRTMAQIYALLLISPDPLTQEDVMEELSISRGNVNMNMRELIGWGIVERVIVSGERKEHFIADKDIYKAAAQIIKVRRQRELDPMMKTIAQLENIEGDKKDKNVKQFTDIMKEIKKMGTSAEKMLDMVTGAEANWFTDTMMKMFK